MLAAGPAVVVGQGPPERGKDLPLQQAHLVLSLPPVCLQIDNISPSGPWKHRKPGERDQSSHLWSRI